MRCEEALDPAGLSLLERLQTFEQGEQAAWIVPRLIEILCRQAVRLPLVVPAEPLKESLHRGLAGLPDTQHPEPAAHRRPGDREAQRDKLVAPDPAGVMAGGDMRDLVRQRPGQLAFAFRQIQQAARHVNEASGQGEGVDLLGVKHPEPVSQMGPSAFARQAQAKALDVVGDLAVFQERLVKLDLGRRPAAQLDLLRLRQAEHLSPQSRREEYESAHREPPAASRCGAHDSNPLTEV